MFRGISKVDVRPSPHISSIERHDPLEYNYEEDYNQTREPQHTNIDFRKKAVIIDPTDIVSMLRYKIEDKDVEEERLQNELIIEPQDQKNLIRVLPYSYIGSDISKIDSVSYPKNYPDWYKRTPAYKLEFSGIKGTEHLSSLIKPGSGNTILNRFFRWVNEDKVVTYCDWRDKLSAIATMLVVIMTFIVTFMQWRSSAKAVYVVDVEPNTTDPDAKQRIEHTKKLNAIANHKSWIWTKMILSGVSAMIVSYNAYKRTTLPKENYIIKSFKKGKIEQIPSPERSKRRIKFLKRKVDPNA